MGGDDGSPFVHLFPVEGLAVGVGRVDEVVDAERLEGIMAIQSRGCSVVYDAGVGVDVAVAVDDDGGNAVQVRIQSFAIDQRPSDEVGTVLFRSVFGFLELFGELF